MTNKLDLTKLYKTQISFTEWFEKIDHELTDNMRLEDNEKRERLAVLNKTIGLPFDKPTKFRAKDIEENSSEFTEFLEKHGDDLCALRLIPLDSSLPKLRMRGCTVKDVSKNWFVKQNIEAEKYRADFVPHSNDYIFSTIFVITESGIFGEIIEGTHAQLTQGFYEKDKPITFSYDFNSLILDRPSKEAEKHIKELLDFLLVEDKEKQKELKSELNATFANNYLQGYFETVTSKDFGTWFCDYNRLLADLYKDFNVKKYTQEEKENVLSGQSVGNGKAKGKIRVIQNVNETFEEGGVLVCTMTTPEYVPLMKKACAIITDLGGILSHAAIVARELQKPCIVGTKTATETLKNGDEVEIDGEKGIIKIL